jgi:tetratricopeptide (TPR) repeat protein
MQYYQAGEYTLAQQAFLTAVRADAAGTPASLGICNFDLGTAELKLGDTSGAIGEFLDATQRDPTYPYAWQDLGIARQATNPTAALVDFDHLLAVQPRSAVGLFFSGILLYEDGQHQLGLARVRQGLVLEPSLRSQLPSVVHLS